MKCIFSSYWLRDFLLGGSTTTIKNMPMKCTQLVQTLSITGGQAPINGGPLQQVDAVG